MSDEALHYRIKLTQSLVWTFAGFLTIVSGGLFMAQPTPGLMDFALAIGLYAMGLMIFTRGAAIVTDGVARSVWSLHSDFDDPPLDEWGDALEQEGAFATSMPVAELIGGEDR